MIKANYESDAGKRKKVPPEEYGTIPHMPFEEYSERLKHFLIMKRENGILEARLHTDGDSMQWGAPAHQGLHYFLTGQGGIRTMRSSSWAARARISLKA